MGKGGCGGGGARWLVGFGLVGLVGVGWVGWVGWMDWMLGGATH